MEKNIIVAVADNNAIGRDNALLWHISEDLKFFKRKTSGWPVIMGRKTYESIGRPLPKRLNIVISRREEAPDGTLVAHSLEEAFGLAAAWPGLADSVTDVITDTVAGAEGEPAARCFVMGGGQIYARAMELADKLIVTHVHTVIEDADTFFPEIDSAVWRVESRSEMMTDAETGYDFEFVEYVRR